MPTHTRPGIVSLFKKVLRGMTRSLLLLCRVSVPCSPLLFPGGSTTFSHFTEV